jgi:hypothetical protein
MNYKKLFVIAVLFSVVLVLILAFVVIPNLTYQVPHTSSRPFSVDLTVTQTNYRDNEYYGEFVDVWNITVYNNGIYTVNRLTIYGYSYTSQFNIWSVNATLNPTNSINLTVTLNNGIEGQYPNVSFVVVGYTQ